MSNGCGAPTAVHCNLSQRWWEEQLRSSSLLGGDGAPCLRVAHFDVTSVCPAPRPTCAVQIKKKKPSASFVWHMPTQTWIRMALCKLSTMTAQTRCMRVTPSAEMGFSIKGAGSKPVDVDNKSSRTSQPGWVIYLFIFFTCSIITLKRFAP